MHLLRLWSGPWIRRHPLRYLLLLLGVTVGVATPVAIFGGTRAVWQDVAATIATLAGRADLVLHAGDGGVPEALLEPVQALPGVEAAAPVIEALTELDDGARLLILGVDVTGDGSLRSWLGPQTRQSRALLIDPIAFIAQPDSVLLAASLARRRHWTIGTRFGVRTATGVRTVTIRGLLDDPAAERIHGGNLAVMDVYGAQQAFARGDRFDRIEVVLRPDAGRERTIAALRRLAGPGIQVEPPLERGAPLRAVLESYGALQTIASVFAAFLGIAMIDAAFRLAVTQRRVEIGILRALGATRSQVQRLFLAEGLLTGVAGAVLGFVLGIGIYNFLARTMGGGYRGLLGGLAQQVYRLEPAPGLAALALGIGVTMSLAASWWPAREAAQVSPVDALRRHPRGLPPLGIPLPPWAAPFLAALALLASLSPRLIHVALLLSILAALALLPGLVSVAVRLARIPARRWLGLEGVLAFDGLLRSSRRTVTTIAALGLVFALGVVIGGLHGSYRRAVGHWIDETFASDLLVSASANLILQPYRFPASFAGEVAALPGVAHVEAVRTRRIPFAGLPRLMVAADDSGPGVRVSEPLAPFAHVTLESPRGPLRLPVTRVVADYADRAGVIYLPRSLYREWWSDDSIDKLRVQLRPGLSPAAGRERLREFIAGRFPAAILTRDEIRASLLDPADRRLSAVQIQQLLVTLVAALALGNFALISVTDRAGEFALIRALGAFRSQIRRRLWIEVAATGFLSWLAGLAGGALLLAAALRLIETNLAFVRLPFVFPWLAATGLLAAAIGTGWLAVLAAKPALDRVALAQALDAE